MTEIVPFSRARDDTLWAVIASVGRQTRIADLYPDRASALNNRAWREHQVAAYGGFLEKFREPALRYSVEPIRRADLPKNWRPLPALGFLRNRFI